MSALGRTVSHHLLRRTARARMRRLVAEAARRGEDRQYAVERTRRGPWRWRVVEVGR